MKQETGQANQVSEWLLRLFWGTLLVTFLSSPSKISVAQTREEPIATKERDPALSSVVLSLKSGKTGGLGQEVKVPAIRRVTEAPVEIVAMLNERPTAVAISPENRIFLGFSTHLGDLLEESSAIRELFPDGSARAFLAPDMALDPILKQAFATVQALVVDSDRILWILDSGSPPNRQPQLIGWDLDKKVLSRLIYLPAPVTKRNSLLQSFVVDARRQMVFIADQGRKDFVGTSESGIISVNLKTGVAWRALEDHYSLNADGGDYIVKGEPLLAPDGKGSLVRPNLGIISVAIDQQGDFVYFGAANGRSVFRIKTEILGDPNLSAAQVGERVQRFGDKPPSHGLFVFAPDWVLISDVNNNAIGSLGPDGRYQVLVSSEELSWPTVFARGNHGEVYVLCSQFHRAPLFHRGQDQSKRPFLIARLYPQLIPRGRQKAQSGSDLKKSRSQR